MLVRAGPATRGRAGSAPGIGSAGPTPLSAPDAERLLAEELPWESPGAAATTGWPAGSATWSAAAASPIDDVRGTAAYRRHALGVLARRTLTWAWTEHRTARP